jgi:hypothetical protein
MRYLTYIRASEGFELNDSSGFGFGFPESASENQRNRAAPSLLFAMHNPSRVADAETALRNAGIRVLETYMDARNGFLNYIVVDASNIDWFAYDL